MAEFRTAADQYTLPLDCAVIGTVEAGASVTSSNRKAAIMRGDFVVLTPANGSVPAYITKATAAQVSTKSATHIIALSDETIGGNYIRTDNGIYRASDLVGATASSATASSPVKKVGLWPIFDWADVIPDADQNDVKA